MNYTYNILNLLIKTIALGHSGYTVGIFSGAGALPHG